MYFCDSVNLISLHTHKYRIPILFVYFRPIEGRVGGGHKPKLTQLKWLQDNV